MRDFKNMKRQRGRNRGSGGSVSSSGKPQQQNANRAFDSNGPENVKIRGHAQHVFEKYQQLARDAFSSGDRVVAENYLQHADHYFRVLRMIQPNRPPSEIMGRDVMVSGLDIDFEEELEAAEETPEGQSEAVETNGFGGEAPRQDGRRDGGFDNRQNADNGYRDRQDRGDFQSRDRQDRGEGQYRDRQDRGEGQYRQDRNGGQFRDRQDRNDGASRSDASARPDTSARTDGQPRGDSQQRDRSDRPDTQNRDQGRDQQDRYDNRRDSRRFDNRGGRDTRSDEPRSPDAREVRYEPDARAEVMPVMTTSPVAEPFPVSTPQSDAPSVLRSLDGGMSEAPAFLQSGTGDDGEVRKPRTRRRRAPRSFEPGEEGGDPETAPASEDA